MAVILLILLISSTMAYMNYQSIIKKKSEEGFMTAESIHNMTIYAYVAGIGFIILVAIYGFLSAEWAGYKQRQQYRNRQRLEAIATGNSV